MSKSILIKSSLAKKYWMALTGLFLCLFLLGHLLGNLQLLISDVSVAKDQFNEYALFMTTNPLIKILSYLTYISILFHVIDGLLLTIHNSRSRDINYIVYKGKVNSPWSSRNMGALGTIILVFIVVHMYMFWGQMKFGDLSSYVTVNGKQVEDLYTLTIKTFQSDSMGLFWVILYALSMIAMGFHLMHGVSSAFQSIGFSNSKINKSLKNIGKIYAVAVSVLFAIIPIYIYFVLEKF